MYACFSIVNARCMYMYDRLKTQMTVNLHLSYPWISLHIDYPKTQPYHTLINDKTHHQFVWVSVLSFALSFDNCGLGEHHCEGRGCISDDWDCGEFVCLYVCGCVDYNHISSTRTLIGPRYLLWILHYFEAHQHWYINELFGIGKNSVSKGGACILEWKRQSGTKANEYVMRQHEDLFPCCFSFLHVWLIILYIRKMW